MMNKKNALLSALCAFAATPAWAEYALNMPEGVTSFSKDVYELHMVILWICVVIGVLVFGAMFYSMAMHRKSKGAKAAQFSHSTKAEIAWTIIPVLILVAIAVPSTRVLVDMESPKDEPRLTIKITGFQWRWKYDYVGEDVSFYSSLADDSNAARQKGANMDLEAIDHYLGNVDNPLVIPVNTQVRFLITADDVIHAWWVPDLGWKRDAIPGFINEAWTNVSKPGTYRGKCAELCGRDHAYMPIVVEVLPQDEYEAWLAGQKGPAVAGAEESESNSQPQAGLEQEV